MTEVFWYLAAVLAVVSVVVGGFLVTALIAGWVASLLYDFRWPEDKGDE